MIEAWSALIGALPFEWASYGFMQYALLAVLLISPLFAALGCMVISNRMAYFSDAIGHAGLTGIAIGTLVGLADPLLSMIGFSLLLAVLVTLFRRHAAASTDTVIGVITAFSVALGVVILSRGGGFARYANFLVGDILGITADDLRLLAALAGVFLVAWIAVFNRLLLVTLSPALARSRNTPVWLIQGLFAVLTALVVTVAIQWIGILVVNALLVLPAGAARNLARSTAGYLALSVLMSLACGIAGLLASFHWETAGGATIVLFAMGAWLLSLVARRFLRRA